VVSSTAAVILRQLVMLVVDKVVVDEDCHVVLANELESISLPDGTTQALRSCRSRRLRYLRGPLSVG
jgi:hypothetical protein